MAQRKKDFSILFQYQVGVPSVKENFLDNLAVSMYQSLMIMHMREMDPRRPLPKFTFVRES